MLTESPRVIAGRMRQHHRRTVGHLVRLRPHRTGKLAPANYQALAQRWHFRCHPEEPARGPFPVLAHLRDHALWTYLAQVDALQGRVP